MEGSLSKVERKGFFVYAWDMVNPGPEAICRRMAEDFCCSGLLINANYHHARVLRPRVNGPKSLHFPHSAAYFNPQEELYEASGMQPSVDPQLADHELLQKTKLASQKTGLDFGIWLVGLHNTTLGNENPDLCVENVFGDIYPYGLCPSHPRNKAYLEGLVEDVCTQVGPDRIVIEAVGPLGLRHGMHHELFLIEWDPVLETLFSICFCSACRKVGEKEGLDISRLRQTLQEIGNQLLDQERGALPVGFRQQEMTSLLMEVDGLWPYLQAGTREVGKLVGSLQRITESHGADLEVIPSSFHRPTSRSWMERGGLKVLADASDQLLISSYFEDPAEVEADLSWVSMLTPDTPFSVGLNACAPTSSGSQLKAQTLAACRAGSRAVYYYNYGLLTERRLAWTRQALLALEE